MLYGYEWNQAEISDENSEPHEGLVTLIAFGSDRSPKIIGTGFIIGAYGNFAVAATASHNFKGIHDIQNPYGQHHPSALQEFLPNTAKINLDKKLVRAIYTTKNSIEFCCINWAIWDKKSDVAFFSLSPQDPSKNDFFKFAFELDDSELKIGDEVAVLGYSDMAVLDEYRDGKGYEQATVQRRLLLRCGRVKQTYPEGHFLCRGSCIETSIPVFSGMSGGPVLRLGVQGQPMRPLGLISSDPDSEDKFDRTIAGASIAAMLGAVIGFNADGQQRTFLRLNEAFCSSSS